MIRNGFGRASLDQDRPPPAVDSSPNPADRCAGGLGHRVRANLAPPAFEEPVQVLPPARQAGTISYARNPERHWLHAGARSRPLYARAQRPDQCMMAPALTLMSCPVMLSAACGAQKEHGLDDVRLVDGALEGCSLCPLGPQLVSSEAALFRHRRGYAPEPVILHEPRRDDIDAYAGGPHLVGKGPGQADDSDFRGCISHPVRQRVLAGH